MTTRNFDRTQSIAAQLTLIALVALAGCSDASNGNSICYSRFSSLEKREFKASLTPSLRGLMDKLASDYANGGDVDIPLAFDGTLYLASTCNYVLLLRRGLDKRIAFTTISKSEYHRLSALTSESGRVIRMEPP